MISKNIPLILGPLPPPIGGVSIHVQRMIFEFNKLNFNFTFVNIKDIKPLVILKNLFSHKTIHLHSSNIYFQLIISIFCFLFRKKVIITFHSDIFRYSFFQLQIIKLILLICDLPIILNLKSLNFAYKFNSKSMLLSSFIIFDEDFEMSKSTIPDFSNMPFEKKFCTYAFGHTYDKNGNEIYQIISLIEIFKNLPNYLLVISDPSDSYSKVISKCDIEMTNNIIFIPYPHSFIQILKQTECFIRFTSTDGDSMSVREALFLNKSVIATNVVDRPDGVTTVNLNKDDLSILIKNFNLPCDSLIHERIPNTIFQLINLYN